MILDNIIFIKGGAYDDVKKALRQWIDLYSKDLEEDLIFELIKNGRGNHIIKADARLDNDSFYFLVNYLYYPEGIDYKAEIEGFTTGRNRDVLKDQKLLVYVSPNDKEGDNVFVTTSDNRSYKVGFNGRISEEKETKAFRLPTEQNFSQSEFLKVNKKEDVQVDLEKLEKEVAKRFKIISFIAMALFTIIFFTSFYDMSIFIEGTMFFGFGLGLWFFSDYKMFQFDKYYVYCLLISVTFLGYTILLKRELDDRNSNHVDWLAFHSLVLLLIQWPMRRLYIFIFKREPKVDKYGNGAERTYTAALFFAFALLPFLLYDQFE